MATQQERLAAVLALLGLDMGSLVAQIAQTGLETTQLDIKSLTATQNATLEILQEVLLVLTELNAKAPRLDTAGRAVVNLADAAAAVTLQPNQVLGSVTSLNGYGGSNLTITATQAAIAEMQQAEFQFLQLINVV